MSSQADSLAVLDPVTRQHVEKAADALQDEFAGTFGRETIARYIAESVDLLGNSSVSVFVPVLAHRFARERLKALGAGRRPDREGAARGPVRLRPQRGPQPDGGGARLAALGGQDPRSLCGIGPRRPVNPLVVEAMAEIGIDLADAFPKPLTDDFVRAADVVITMGCGDACPIYPGKRYEDWAAGRSRRGRVARHRSGDPRRDRRPCRAVDRRAAGELGKRTSARRRPVSVLARSSPELHRIHGAPRQKLQSSR